VKAREKARVVLGSRLAKRRPEDLTRSITIPTMAVFSAFGLVGNNAPAGHAASGVAWVVVGVAVAAVLEFVVLRAYRSRR
jgi:hypothetical protein